MKVQNYIACTKSQPAKDTEGNVREGAWYCQFHGGMLMSNCRNLNGQLKGWRELDYDPIAEANALLDTITDEMSPKEVQAIKAEAFQAKILAIGEECELFISDTISWTDEESGEERSTKHLLIKGEQTRAERVAASEEATNAYAELAKVATMEGVPA